MTATTWLWLAIGAGVIAVLYGVFSTTAILKLPAGNARMQDIAAAIQAGAKAYLNRQYTTIAIVGVVLFVLIGFALNWVTAGGFAIGAILSGLAGYIGMKIAGARQCAHRPSGQQWPQRGVAGGLQRRRHHRHARCRPGVVGCCWLLDVPAQLRIGTEAALHALVGPAFGGSLISIFALYGRRNLHQGRRRRCRPGGQGGSWYSRR